ncbi:helix-turn-helix transcriptional regulator [Nocardia salmonicida]|uniref:helix-turn-helix transcriptional regulator n=1 Tax=Nocardia salmonicida TaxID=53431 RepID=UPI003CF7A0D9
MSISGGTMAVSGEREQSALQWPVPGLSPRELEVMLAWILSDSKSEVCQTLYLAPGTVNTHLTRIREKYGRVGRPAPTKAALLARALQDGHLRLDEI